MRRACNKHIVFFSFIFFLAIGACNWVGPNFRSLSNGNCYIAQYKEGSVVLCIDEVTNSSLEGRWYVEGEACCVTPHCFKATAGLLHKGELRSDSLIVMANANQEGDSLTLNVLFDGAWRRLCFQPLSQPPVMEIQRDYPYYDSLFEVNVDTNVVYAYAKGYWTSYPEPEYDCDDYLPILMDKWTDEEEMTLKDNLALTMDVYTPVTNDTEQCPLLMLIHGGAFFNGDKQSAGYKEWGHFFASRGYVVASINYRLGYKPFGPKRIDRAGYRALQDARAAMSYLLYRPEQYRINPNCLFVAGSSAGAITALNLAFMGEEDRPVSSYAGVVNDAISNTYVRWARKHPRLQNKMHKEVGLEDLGDIDFVAEKRGNVVDFTINTVVNMWGAVHKIEMIDTDSLPTAILSFHCDADPVVPYGYGHPFTNMEPFNQLLCNKMYGSKCIHERALQQGRKSELHTRTGTIRHSLHADCRELTEYFDLITDTTMHFLYFRMFPRPTMHSGFWGRQQWFEIRNAGGLKTCRWETVGGLVLEAESDKARVIFFDDAPEHKIRIVGQKNTGEGYDEIYGID